MNIYNYISRNYYLGFNTSIRGKVDIIKIVLNISKFLTSGAMKKTYCWTKEAGYTNLTFCVDKMRRIFIESESSIHSFYFPFLIKEESDFPVLFFNKIKLEQSILSQLISAFNDYSDKISITYLIEKIWDLEGSEHIADSEIELVEKIANYLLCFEPGYVRYDNDEIKCISLDQVVQF